MIELELAEWPRKVASTGALILSAGEHKRERPLFGFALASDGFARPSYVIKMLPQPSNWTLKVRGGAAMK